MFGQKKLLLLGGLRYLLPVIEVAHKLGHYVITCDYLPDNIAHKYSDEYRNVSIIDKEAVLRVAKELQIDGIMSFAVDPGVVTAAYVQEQMGLPGNPYESVLVLQNKDRFRQFLAEYGFNVPKATGYGSVEEAWSDKGSFEYPVIVKPTDSAGSKGVARVDRAKDLWEALENAMSHSISGRIIVEEFIEKEGCSSDSDCFSVDGELKFVSFSAQRFDADAPNPYTPSAYSWPSTMTGGAGTGIVIGVAAVAESSGHADIRLQCGDADREKRESLYHGSFSEGWRKPAVGDVAACDRGGFDYKCRARSGRG